MKIIIETKTNCRKPLAAFWEHVLKAIDKGVSGGTYAYNGEPVAEWWIVGKQGSYCGD